MFEYSIRAKNTRPRALLRAILYRFSSLSLSSSSSSLAFLGATTTPTKGAILRLFLCCVIVCGVENSKRERERDISKRETHTRVMMMSLSASPTKKSSSSSSSLFEKSGFYTTTTSSSSSSPRSLSSFGWGDSSKAIREFGGGSDDDSDDEEEERDDFNNDDKEDDDDDDSEPEGEEEESIDDETDDDVNDANDVQKRNDTLMRGGNFVLPTSSKRGEEMGRRRRKEEEEEEEEENTTNWRKLFPHFIRASELLVGSRVNGEVVFVDYGAQFNGKRKTQTRVKQGGEYFGAGVDMFDDNDRARGTSRDDIPHAARRRNTQTARWYTTTAGVKTYVTKTGQKLTGSKAYDASVKDSRKWGLE